MVSFTVGVYDLFANAIPGSLYAALITYIATRAGWLRTGDVEVTGVLGLVAVALVSYLLGHITYGLFPWIERRVPWLERRRPTVAEARAIFRRRVPSARQRPYVDADHAFLVAAAEAHARQGASEIARLQALSLMLRNSAPALLLGAAVAAVELVTGDAPLFAVTAALLLAVFAAAAVNQAWRIHRWVQLKTLETAYWIPGIDDLTGQQAP